MKGLPAYLHKVLCVWAHVPAYTYTHIFDLLFVCTLLMGNAVTNYLFNQYSKHFQLGSDSQHLVSNVSF